MKTLGRIKIQILVIFVLSFLLSGLVWFACNQESPIDPTRSVSEGISLLVNMTANPARIRAGGEKSEIQVRVLSEEGLAVRNVPVIFSTTLGMLKETQALTDQYGWARTELISGAVPGDATVTATYQKFSTSVTVQFTALEDTTGFNLLIDAKLKEILANGVDVSTVTILLIPRGTQSPAGKTVMLTATAGTIPSTVILDAQGKGEVELVSSADSVDVVSTVTARYLDRSVSTNVVFKGVQFRVEANPKVIFADGVSFSTIRAILKETTTLIGIPQATVRFGTVLGTIEAQKNTDGSGVAEVKLVSGTTPGKSTVYVRYGKTFLKTLEVEFQSPTYTMELIPAATFLLADGVSSTQVKVKVRDANLNPLVNQPVFFATTVGSIDYVQYTDNNGEAIAKLTSSARKTDVQAMITATLGEGGVSKTAAVLFKGVDFWIEADPNYIVADGVSHSTVTAYVIENTDRIGVEGGEVLFGTNLGTIPSSKKTDAQGVASVQLTSSKTNGTARVIGRYGNLFLDTVYVTFGPPVPPTLHSIYANPKYILANGVEQAWISVKVVDGKGSALPDVMVNFSATVGTISSSQEMTDKNGVAVVSLTSVASSSDVVSTVTARVGTQSISTDVVFEGVDMTVSALPTTILADGRSTSTISVILKRTTSKIAIANAVVEFATTLGTIPNQATTNSQGVAEVKLTSSHSVGIASVTATYGSAIQKTVTVTFQESVPTYLEVTATPPVLPADGQSQSVIRATVTDANRNPVPDGTVVLFEIQSGTGTLERQKTTSNGIATSTLTAGTQPGTTVIQVSVGSLIKTISVVYTVGEVAQVIVTAQDETGNPITSLPADGKTNAVIQARVLDAQGNPVSGKQVTFSASIGDITPTAMTNSQGIATAQFSSGVVGTATVTATAKEANGTPVSGFVTIKLLPGAANTITLRFDSTWIGVRDTGRNQTTTIYASVWDNKNNPVADGTLVKFRFLDESLGCTFSTNEPIPTVGGTAQIALTSGTISGTVRIRAEVVDSQGNPVDPPITSSPTYLLIHAGPAYMQDINNPATTGLTVTLRRLNIWWMHDTTSVTISVFDKYGNPVDEGTAVYLTISGGGITVGEGEQATVTYTNKDGMAYAKIISGYPLPTIDRFYNYFGMQDPNTGEILPGPTWYELLSQWLLPNFEAPPDSAQPGESYPGIQNCGFITNSEGNTMENDGIARILAYTVGMDSAGNTVKVWNHNGIVMSSVPSYADNSCEVFAQYGGVLSTGQSAVFRVRLMDSNGNPVASGTTITATLTNPEVQAEISPQEIVTGAGMGKVYYYFIISNKIDPKEPKPGVTSVQISWSNPFYSEFARTCSVLIDQ